MMDSTAQIQRRLERLEVVTMQVMELLQLVVDWSAQSRHELAALDRRHAKAAAARQQPGMVN